MSLQLRAIPEVPESTRHIAERIFVKGNPYLFLRDHLGTIFMNEDFKELYPKVGQPALAPWRLALVTLMQFREDLSDRQAAEAVRSRIDWKYLLGLELDDPGFNFSVLSEFRSRLLTNDQERLLLDKLLELCRDRYWIKKRGLQRTDATYVIGAVREMTRLEQIGESLRAALNDLASLVPDWLQAWVPLDWYERYSRRIEQEKLPTTKTEQKRYAQKLGLDAYTILDHIQQSEMQWLLNVPTLFHLQTVLSRHFERTVNDVRYKDKKEVQHLPPDVESPYDPEVRYRLRRENKWVGYQLQFTETCDEDFPHLITDVATMTATDHEVVQPPLIHERLQTLDILPAQHFVDGAYLSAQTLLDASEIYDVQLIGPPRPDTSWQARTEGAFDYTAFKIDWEAQHVCCPNGKVSSYWYEIDRDNPDRAHGIKVRFNKADCLACLQREKCTRAKGAARTLRLPERPLYEALETMRTLIDTDEGKTLYKKRAGIEGTISHAVRSFGARQTRYIGLAKSHLQNIAIAAAINIDRLFNWFSGKQLAQTRVSAFAKLAPT